MTASDPVQERSYDLHGISVRASVSEPLLAERIHTFLVHLGLEPRTEPRTEPDLELELGVGEPSRRGPGEPWRTVSEMGIDVFCEGSRVVVRDEHAELCIELEAGRAEGVVRPSADGEPRLHMNLASYALLTLLRGHHLFPLHAAAVARNGVGLLIVADSGGGKSTLAADLLLSGWQFLSDDSLLLRPGADGIEALALRRDLFLRRGAGPLTDAPDPEPWPDPAKVRIDARRRFADRVSERCQPCQLIFPEIVEQTESRLEPCAPAEALRLLVHHSLVAELEPTRAPAHMGVLASLVKQCRSHRLLAGRDLVAESGLAARLLAHLCDNP